MSNMVSVAKKVHAAKIVKKLGYPEFAKGYKEHVKDLLKLNYATLVELSTLIQKKGGK